MKTVKKIVDGIEALSIWSGKIASWLIIILMLLICFGVVMRYVFVKPTIWGYELSLMLGGALLLMLAYVQQRDAHIKVEILYEKASTKRKALINVLGTVIFAYPCFIYLIIGAYRFMINAFVTNEKMAESFWYPPAAPFRTVIFIALCLAILQFTASFIRNLHMLIKGEPL
jgi:TRAP-type mannitol/chloroaromatic compound transport system permease small subunit